MKNVFVIFFLKLINSYMVGKELTWSDIARGAVAPLRAGHGRAEEDIDDEHDQEEDAKGDAEVEEPDRRDPTALADVWYLDW